MIIKNILVILGAMILCSCVTIAQKTASNEAPIPLQENETLVIMYWPSSSDAGISPIDISTNKFTFEEGIYFHTLTESKLKNNTGNAILGHFHVRPGKPGHYAFTNSVSSNDSDIYVRCYGEGTFVYRIKEGVINFVSLGHFEARSNYKPGSLVPEDSIEIVITPPSDEELAKQLFDLKNILEDYPNITGEIEVAQITHRVRFDHQTGPAVSGTRMCPANENFEILEKY